MGDKRWDIAQPVPLEAQVGFSELHPVLLQVLWNRGVQTEKDIERFLHPDWTRDAFSPWLFRSMETAVERILRAIREGEHITIHGDYDADGVCGASLLLTVLRDIMRMPPFHTSNTPSVFLPHRVRDGYGLSVATVEHLHEHENTKLIITVDCGISSNAAIARAQEFGIDVIVCDHHQLAPEIPSHATLLHPLVPSETYPNQHLCGTGVAYKLAIAIIETVRREGGSIPEGYEKWLLDLVAIATVTDVVPLKGENRALESFGLRVLNKTKRPGLKALLRAAAIEGKPLDTWAVGFQIGPRINAAGRMSDARAAFELLTCEDEGEAAKLASSLNAINTERQRVSDELFQAAIESIGTLDDTCLLFAVGEGWPIGVAGLVAGKLCTEYGLPVFVLCGNKGEYTGSGRSIHGFDVTAAMKSTSDVLEKFGGHPQACGVTLRGEERLQVFMKRMHEQAAEFFQTRDRRPRLSVDAVLPLSQVTPALADELSLLEPHGEGNPKPLFLTRGLHVRSVQAVGGKQQHLRMMVSGGDMKDGRTLIGFRIGDRVQDFKSGDTIDVVFEIGMNVWNGRKEVQLVAKDVRKSEV